ncbi:Regulatory GAL4 [Hyphodiscus hymeniophilus]|uniref:Regulatory GAL4 n=1 Tax=Hyphodiscus hymeniophilus TaxID=353542 RepID=A0A9P6VDG3_9HELO|nr:Regulatory GAL4 [Hyphodiscus hymeniophilus]
MRLPKPRAKANLDAQVRAGYLLKALSPPSLDALRLRLEDATNILKRLFPASSLDELIPLPRETLIALLDDVQPRARHPSVAGGSSTDDNSLSPRSAHMPRASTSPATFEYNESIENLEGVEAVADDVNALSLRSDRTSSYVGTSSAMAGLRVLLKVAPDLKPAKQSSALQIDSSSPGFGASSQVGGRGIAAKAPTDPWSLINAYFQRIHPSTPILDELLFRETFESRERKDSAWLGLLYMVYALGTIAYTTSDSNEDIYYYKIAKSHVSLDSFGSGHIETLQALTLMTGWYLHYRNRPNMASAIMGAVFRMAHALGLHKELLGEDTSEDKQQRELRRRIWWSLVVLDTGEGSTLGRVSNTNIFDSEFSRQASKIQARLISSPSLEFTETLALDAHLVYWFESLPSFLRAPEPCPDWLLQPRSSAKWKYQNLRIMLHRPVLMEATLRHIPFQELNGDQKVCVRKCQLLAGQAIENVASEWTQNQYSGWPAVWFLFQACIIPLLSLYGFNDDSQQIDNWNQQVLKAVQLFKEMEPWSIAARQTHELESGFQSKNSGNYFAVCYARWSIG